MIAACALPMIDIMNLIKSFGTVQAVKGVSFSVNPGEVFGLLGPNGAGKTTTILMLVGALAPDRGAVKIDGNLDPARRLLAEGPGRPARLALARAVQLTLASGLTLLGISAPERLEREGE